MPQERTIVYGTPLRRTLSSPFSLRPRTPRGLSCTMGMLAASGYCSFFSLLHVGRVTAAEDSITKRGTATSGGGGKLLLLLLTRVVVPSSLVERGGGGCSARSSHMMRGPRSSSCRPNKDLSLNLATKASLLRMLPRGGERPEAHQTTWFTPSMATIKSFLLLRSHTTASTRPGSVSILSFSFSMPASERTTALTLLFGNRLTISSTTKDPTRPVDPATNIVFFSLGLLKSSEPDIASRATVERGLEYA
mmetsp:Transcript_47220/g.94511  ORF Transcript_47220/g.94511 Transcript_47220/m.94511 type:complete len:249 (-) Transcript_47220:146-892(-)